MSIYTITLLEQDFFTKNPANSKKIGIYKRRFMAKILFVEDDPLIVKIYTTRLKADGYEVFSADNGEAGLKLAEENLPDLIVLDIMMPKMDGFAVLERLRAHPQMQKTPIILYSNLAHEDEITRAKTLGATEFIVKANLSPTEMVEKIKQYLQK
ncbi:MAG: Two-component response regulator [Candidatus Gottesmanbacteria bacterium GW2011_GWB1_43_11]|uniref:Two-component response regulator n=1 Tax=Candidatus Gottesmanbacteria bacterium GW2011_GWB1_43_11 TaxID=1618446 RepID=A0A0G1EVI5_9BACT|nr:MAG: Two-component response regulator [Candidatus Gottesmanbacteria bacterium GW2011_GWA2_42_16]KKS55953.1 MAG: Two-component response regulator [Candidatus Gottesmanbacteria bacterium GW2011_GWA1_42_26]KKS87041.1 MAG: Two-component response regulator [Candidatus Gottesmanbacteria bacterium GW2011_GWB1_43_11]HCM38175.1 response regulator [Patescibacteria group bacterium]